MQSQENRPPMNQSPPMNQPAKEAPFGSPRPVPVKNTFIHYGTPIRHNTGVRGTPKTVPPDFAPEAELLDASLAPFPGASSGSAIAGPVASPMPNTGGRPGPEAFRAGADRDGLPARGRGVAPLRLFDFLPSPTVQAPPSQVLQMMPQVPAMIPPSAAPSSSIMGVQAAPTLAQPSWSVEHLVQAPTMTPAPTYTPMIYNTDGGLQTTSLQPATWPSWNAPTSTVQLAGATAHCLGPVNNPVIPTGMTMPANAGSTSMSMMAQPPMYMAATGPAAQQTSPPLLPSKA